MVFKKRASKIIAASLLTGSVLGIGAPSFMGSADAASGTSVSSSTENQKAVETLNNLYDSAFLGEMPGLVYGLKINDSTKGDVHKKIGLPEEPANKDNPFDRYHGSMGQASYAFAYHKDGTISEIRYFGTQVERQQNLGGITPAVLSKQIGSADKILSVPDTNEIDYVYQTGKYELHFVVGSDQKVDHVNLTTNKTHISSGPAAAKYLRHQLKMDHNDDIVFSDMGGDLKTDKTGSYYTIKLTSKSLQNNGGTGTVGLYKVYQNGTYTLKN